MQPPAIEETANQPLRFSFPMREFGKKTIVKWAFKPKWFSQWGWLHYDSCHDRAFCFICVKAVTTCVFFMPTRIGQMVYPSSHA